MTRTRQIPVEELPPEMAEPVTKIGLEHAPIPPTRMAFLVDVEK